MTIIEPISKTGTPYFAVTVRRVAPDGKSKSRFMRFKPETPQEESMSVDEIVALIREWLTHGPQ